MTPDPTLLDAKRVQAAALEDENKRLDERIQNLTQRTVALQEESEKRRLEMSQAYRERFAKRFADLEVEKALAGYATQHDVTVFGAVYRLRPPKQSTMLEVDKFAAKPEPAELAPVSAAERVLLSWLVGVGAAKEIRSLDDKTLGDRLALIRRMPETMLSKLADECASMDTYLSVVLELELGNS